MRSEKRPSEAQLRLLLLVSEEPVSASEVKARVLEACVDRGWMSVNDGAAAITIQGLEVLDNEDRYGA